MDIENEFEDDAEIIAAFADFMTAYTQRASYATHT